MAAWSPRPIPIHRMEAEHKPSDPRLAAALAARERWHGRSGRPALKSATQAIAFVRERRLVHPLVESPFPNLLDPVVGKPCSEEEREQGQARTVLDGWMSEIHAAPDILETRLCFERPTLVQADLWSCLLPIANQRHQASRQRGVLSPEGREALEIIERREELGTQRLAQLLDMSPEEMALLQAELEARLLVVAHQESDDEDQPVTTLRPLVAWLSQASYPRREMEPSRAWTLLFIASLRSAVVLWPEEIESMLPWTREEREAALAEAMRTGTVMSYTDGDARVLVSSPVPR